MFRRSKSQNDPNPQDQEVLRNRIQTIVTNRRNSGLDSQKPRSRPNKTFSNIEDGHQQSNLGVVHTENPAEKSEARVICNDAHRELPDSEAPLNSEQGETAIYDGHREFPRDISVDDFSEEQSESEETLDGAESESEKLKAAQTTDIEKQAEIEPASKPKYDFGYIPGINFLECSASELRDVKGFEEFDEQDDEDEAILPDLQHPDIDISDEILGDEPVSAREAEQRADDRDAAEIASQGVSSEVAPGKEAEETAAGGGSGDHFSISYDADNAGQTSSLGGDDRDQDPTRDVGAVMMGL